MFVFATESHILVHVWREEEEDDDSDEKHEQKFNQNQSVD